jgi:hypothetical protein
MASAFFGKRGLASDANCLRLRRLLLREAMNFPKFWALGTVDGMSAWRWSDVSNSDAQALADAAARAVATRRADGLLHDPGQHYYADCPLREPVLREFPGIDGAPAAVVTRNTHGCLVLNAARALFVDIDIPETPKKKSGGGFFASLFGRPPKPEPTTPADSILEPLRRWQQANAGWSWRIYRTAAGYRLLATHDVFEPNSSIVEAVFEGLRADPLYRKLCRAQQCFRARLTPKPWRCGQRGAHHNWPWPNPNAERRFERWRVNYEQASARYATCRFLRTEGSTSIHHDLAPLVAFHDETSRAMVNAPLA